MKKISLFLFFLAAGVLFCPDSEGKKTDFSPASTVTTVSYAKKSPSVDGKISTGEYSGSFEQAGFLKHNSALLTSRQGKSFAALDGKYLYLACQTELPDPESGVSLKKKFKKRDGAVFKDDSVEFLIFPPDGNALYHLIINPANVAFDLKYPVKNGGISPQVREDWDPKSTIKSSFDKKYWTLELKIPLEDLKTSPGKKDSLWKFQFARSWQNPGEACAFNKVLVYADPDNMNPVLFKQNTPVVRFCEMGDHTKGDYNFEFAIDNPTDKPVSVKYKASVTSEAAPRNMDETITVPAGKTKNVSLKYSEKARLNSEMNLVFQNAETGGILLKRSFQWVFPFGKRWIAPDQESGAQLEIGVYPYYKKIRARLGNHGTPLDMRKVKSAIFRITDKNGAPVGKNVIPQNNSLSGYLAELELPSLPKGDYFVEAILTKDNGKTDSYKTKFFFNTYEWEHNTIGKDRIVIPPYKELEYMENRVKTLMAEYTFADGFFSSISAGKADSLLAEPVVLKINGVPAKGNALKWIEKSKDLAVSEQQITAADGTVLKVRHELEFDNFIKTTLTIPAGGFKCSSMTLEIPLKTEFAKQIHATCNTMKYNAANALPDREGELWNSSEGKLHSAVSNNFRPYIWLGNMAEGIAFFAESDKNWGRDPNKPMAQIIREKEKTTLRINLADMETKYDQETVLVFGFQATPTRCRPNSSRQLTERFNAANSVRMALLAGGGCWSCEGYDFFPKNKDYSFIRELKRSKAGNADEVRQREVIEPFMKHFSDLPADRQDFFRRHMYRGITYANMSDLIIPYMNARASHLRWEEYQVFMDEWFCSDYRANNEDDYNNTPTESYQDFLLFWNRKLIREGLDGIYYDNIRDWHNPNMVTGPAYITGSGKVQPYFDIFDMRNLIKRTAIMVCQEGATIFDGRPLLVLHMTNTNIVPFTSLGSISLDMEAMFGAMDFQDRFSEDYIKTCTLGLQSGAIPEVLIQISGDNKEFVTRTFLAVTLAYDIPMVLNGGGTTSTWYKIWNALKKYGYGTDEVEVFPCFAPSGKFRIDAADVRVTEYRKKDGSTVLALCSYGHDGTLSLPIPEEFTQAADFETGRKLELKNNLLNIQLNKHDFRLIQFN